MPMTPTEKCVEQADGDEYDDTYLGDDIPATDEDKQRFHQPDRDKDSIVLGDTDWDWTPRH